jgi:hypothetical protein
MGSSEVSKVNSNPASDQGATSAPESVRATASVESSTSDSTTAPKSALQYYDLVTNWSKIEPHLGEEELNRILVRDFNIYSLARTGETFTAGMFPQQLHEEWLQRQKDLYDESWDPREGDPQPHWKYVKGQSCHWIANFTLRLAMLVEPQREWRILSGDKHSTVWDGKDTIFDFNYFTNGVPVDECFENASEGDAGFDVGEYIAASNTHPEFAPEMFKASEHADYKMDVIFDQAKEYHKRLVNSIKHGALADDVDATVFVMGSYRLVKDFIDAMAGKNVPLAATILQNIVEFRGKALTKALRKIRNVVDREAIQLLQRVQKSGNLLLFVKAEDTSHIEAGFIVRDDGTVVDADDGPAEEDLRQAVFCAISSRWDWVLSVRKKGNKADTFYRFEHYNAVRQPKELAA